MIILIGEILTLMSSLIDPDAINQYTIPVWW